MRLLLNTCCVWLALVLLPPLVQAQSAAPAEPVHLRGSYVLMDLPPGFVEDPNVSGATWVEAQASILVTELPVDAFKAISDGLINDPKALLGDGIELHAAANVVQHGHPGVLAQGRQQVAGNLLTKWLLLIGAPHVTVLVTAQAPTILVNPERQAVIDRALASIRVSATRDDPRDSLPFVFAESERMQFARILSGTTALLIARGEDKGEAVRPIFAIGTSLGNDCSPWADGKTQFAEQLIGSMKRTENLADVASRKAEIHGHPALLTEATATWHAHPVALFQTISFRGCEYLRTIGIVPIADAAAYRSEFESLANAARWRNPANNPIAIRRNTHAVRYQRPFPRPSGQS